MIHYNMSSRFQGGFTAKRKNTTLIIVHHAAALYKQMTGTEDVIAVANYHTQTRRWPGIGYHTCLAEKENGGVIARYDVSDPRLARAHIYGLNHTAVGVSCLTNFTGVPADKWIDGLVVVIGEWLERWPAARVVGHGEVALSGHSTVCPGPAWQQWKHMLLKRLNQPLLSTALQIKDKLSHDPADNFAAVRQGPGRDYPEAKIGDVPYRLLPGSIWAFDDVSHSWAHLENDMGFVHISLLKGATEIAPADDLSIMAAPRISLERFVRVLIAAKSPAANAGPDMYRLCVEYEIDPGILLAFFRHESSLGKAGICSTYQTHSPGNVRSPWSARLGHTFAVPGRGNFTRYATWQEGTEDMCQRLRHRYIGRGLDTVRKAIPVWAPRSDGNSPEDYIKAVIGDVRAWQKADQQ